MGWSNWPDGYPRTMGGTDAYKDVQFWGWFIQPWYAMRERHTVLGSSSQLAHWPPPDFEWNSGNVDSITDNGDTTITIAVSGVDWTLPYGGSGERWVDFNPGSGPCAQSYIPSNYDLILETDRDDPFKVTRGTVIAQTYVPSTSAIGDPPNGTGTLTIDGTTVLNAITAGYFNALSDLVGSTYHFIREGGTWTSERWPDKPDDQQRWAGQDYTEDSKAWLGDAGSSSEGYEYTTIKDATGTWNNDQWAPEGSSHYEVLFYDGDGLLHREPIHHNDGDTLYIEQQDYDTGNPPGDGPFAIVEAGAVSLPGRQLSPIYTWYTGRSKPYYTHLSDDTLGTWAAPDSQYSYEVGNPCNGVDCTEGDFDPFDADLQIPWDSRCEPARAGSYIAPKFWKSFREIQVDVLLTCGSFVPMTGGYTGSTYTPATLFAACGINAGSSALAHDTATDAWSFSADAKYNGFGVWWTVVGRDGIDKASGTGTVAAGSVAISGFSDTGDPATTDVGLTVLYSAGYTRYRPRHFRYLFDKTSFIPSTTPEGAAIDPPTAEYDEDAGGIVCDCGTWITRPKSTGYKVRDTFGEPFDGPPFIAGEYARYVGDNAPDPTVYPESQPGTPQAGLAPYWDKFYRGNYDAQHQSDRDGSRGGSATAGTPTSLTDDGKDWWDDFANPDTELHTESGTATGGSSTTLVDGGHDISTKPNSCWWDGGRFNGAGTYVGFVLEVARDVGGSEPLMWRVPITGASGGAGGVTISFAATPGLSVASGDTWQIREPAYELNKWQGRTLNLSNSFGSNYTTVITQSDDTTLYFTAPTLVGTAAAGDSGSDTVPAAGWGYEIVEPHTGGVWKWDATHGKWVVPSGADAVRCGVPAPRDFLDDQPCNLETITKEYGLFTVDDLINEQLFKEVYYTINALQWTQGGCNWDNKPSPTAAEERTYLTGLSGATWKEQNFALKPIVGDGTWTPYPDNPDYGYTDYGIGESFGDAKDEAQRRWAETIIPGPDEFFDDLYSTGELPDVDDYNDGLPPQFISPSAPFGEAITSCNGCVNGSYGVELIGEYAYPFVTGLCTAIPCSVDFWCFTKGVSDTKDDPHAGSYSEYDGDCGGGTVVWVSDDNLFTGASEGLAYWQWTNPSSGSIDGNGTCYGSKVGGDLPDAKCYPPDPLRQTTVDGVNQCHGGISDIAAGFRVSNQASIMKWSFQYVGPYHD